MATENLKKLFDDIYIYIVSKKKGCSKLSMHRPTNERLKPHFDE